MKMIKCFLRGISAAGIKHVVSEKNSKKRIFWMLSVTLIGICMILMSYRVLLEYFNYPKALQTTTVYLKELEFPAVTICSRYLVPRINAKEAKLEHLEELTELLESDDMPVKEVSSRLRYGCARDPLCRWNRIFEECQCIKNPCLSPLCISYNRTVCSCSEYLCLWNQTKVPGGCRNFRNDTHNLCLCNRSLKYSYFNGYSNSREYNESHFTNSSQKLLELMRILKNSKSSDLSDQQFNIVPEPKILDDYGISYDTIILSCRFAGRRCNIQRDITTIYSPTFGKCYMFNYYPPTDNEKDGKPKIVKQTGRLPGLLLYLQSEKKNTFPLLMRQTGARIVIHDPRSLPFTRSSGFDIRHGAISSMSVKLTHVKRLSHPWGKCAKDGDNTTSNYLIVPYNQIACERTCLNNFVFKRCKCYHRYFLSATVEPVGTKLCRSRQDKCFADVMREINSNEVQCNCPPACREKAYKVRISACNLNKEFFRVLKKARSLKIVNGTPSVVNPNFRIDMLGIEVFYNSLSITNRTETSIYSWEFLIANIGGNMGLFLGLSLVTFVEIAEFLFDFLLANIRKIYKSRRVKTMTS
ncbi:amiloride-sensitive sodium channel subunit beta-like [Parasteatoda tepidariorum]|uniref:amiloride-sensitive sodium channel subunit beta-like n=1 Tax=Parasteatoda tepidariorum TaxID=114398 RepID=UPI0039BC86E6